MGVKRGIEDLFNFNHGSDECLVDLFSSFPPSKKMKMEPQFSFAVDEESLIFQLPLYGCFEDELPLCCATENVTDNDIFMEDPFLPEDLFPDVANTTATLLVETATIHNHNHHNCHTATAGSLLFPASIIEQPKELAPILSIVEGLNYMPPCHERQRGGKGNTSPLPKHVIRINRSGIISGVNSMELILEVFLLGFNKKDEKIDTIAKIKSMKVTPKEDHVIINDLVITYATHHYGNKPFTLLFVLKSEGGIELGHVTSCPFRTRTKRGDEKDQKKKRKKQNINCTIESITPSTFRSKGEGLMRIYLGDTVADDLKDGHIVVMFGDVESRVYTYVSESRMIICEIPPCHNNNNVQIRVSLNQGANYLESTCMFQYHSE